MRPFLRNGFWRMNIPFGSIVEFQFLAQLPDEHISHPVMPSPYTSYTSLLHFLI